MTLYPPYEIVLVLDPEWAAVNWTECESEVRALFQKYEGEILHVEKGEDSRLAYPLKKQKRGTYVVVHVRLNPAQVASLRRACELHTKILRILILRGDTAKRLSESFRRIVLKQPTPAKQTGRKNTSAETAAGTGSA